MKKILRTLTWTAALCVGCLGVISLHAQTNYNLTVKSGPLRQTFEGFGVCSIPNWSTYDPTLRTQAASMVYTDLKMNVVRCWLATTTGTGTLRSPAQMVSSFNTDYIASGYINTVKTCGVGKLLLAPAGNGTTPPTFSLSEYADNLAETILQLKNTYNVQLDFTGISNEPGSWTPAQVVECVTHLRAALDSRGLTNVKIIAPESSASNYGHSGMHQIDGLIASGTAWNGLYGIASHSYAPLQDHEFENRKRGKQWWITEAGAAGAPVAEWAEDENRAAWIFEIFLGNMNHGVTEWIHFNGPKQVPDYYTAPGDPTHLVVIDAKTKTLIPYLKYYYFKQALSVQDQGAIFRKCFSDLEGDMFRASNKQNAAVNASAAYNPDRSWGINIINATGVTGIGDGNLFYAATTYNVNLTIEELVSTGTKTFTVYRSRANNHFVQSGTLNLVNGTGTVSVAPRELVSLRSGTAALTIPPIPGGLKYATVNDHLGLTWNNTVNATSWKVKRATTSGGPYTTIATTTDTFYDDTSAASGMVYYYVVSAVNSKGESANSTELTATPASFPWTNADVGTVGVNGSYSVDDNLTFTIFGSGTNVGGTADAFNFTYVPMSGDGTLIARIAKPGGANTKIGIVMRETLDAGSKSAMSIYNFNSYWNQVQMINRVTTGGTATSILGAMTGNPMWLKLVRSGATFTSYASLDGSAWTATGTTSIPMATNIYAGMSVCAVSGTLSTRAFFDNVTVTPGTPAGTAQIGAAPGQIKIGWPASFGATSYTIKRGNYSGGPYTTTGTTTAPMVNYTDTAVTGGTNYHYVVSPVNAAGQGPDSAARHCYLTRPIKRGRL